VEIVIGPERATPPPHGSAVTIGAYDGVHLGHRYLLAELQRQAIPRQLSTVVVTFDRHPATVVRPASAPVVLTDLEQKLELLASTGVDRTLVVPFDTARAHESAHDFVMEVLVRALGARVVVVGEDFHFGHERAGNVVLLRSMGEQYGFEVVGLALEEDGTDQPVSSTRIRHLLAAGDVEGAAALLGRPHQVRGVVERGDGRGGEQLGFPTANVAVPDGLAMPAEGIYACWYERPDATVHAAAAALGRRLTFHPESATPVLEVYLLDFEDDLYGEPAKVSFVARLRAEERFDTVEALVAQMTDDVAAARRVLGPIPGHAAPGHPAA
jgi:riboflavin kinase/FMN adenylyltransferase